MSRRTIYKAAPGAVFNDGQAQSVGQEVEGIPTWPEVTPDAVVNAARSESSAMHGLFEWRDDVAAERYRVQQARHILNHLITVTSDGQPMKVYHNTTPESGTRRYVHIDKVRTTPTDASQVLENASAELEAWRVRYNVYASVLGPLFGAVDEALVEYRESRRAA